MNQQTKTNTEGFVVRDSKFRRLKIKSATYVALSHLNTGNKEAVNLKHLLKIVQTNEADEFISYFGEFRQQYQSVKNAFEMLVSEFLNELNLKTNENEKEKQEINTILISKSGQQLTNTFKQSEKYKELKNIENDEEKQKSIESYVRDFLSSQDTDLIYELLKGKITSSTNTNLNSNAQQAISNETTTQESKQTNILAPKSSKQALKAQKKKDKQSKKKQQQQTQNKNKTQNEEEDSEEDENQE